MFVYPILRMPQTFPPPAEACERRIVETTKHEAVNEAILIDPQVYSAGVSPAYHSRFLTQNHRESTEDGPSKLCLWHKTTWKDGEDQVTQF